MGFHMLQPTISNEHGGHFDTHSRELWAVLHANDVAHFNLWTIALKAIRNNGCCRCKKGAAELIADREYVLRSRVALTHVQRRTNALQDAPADPRAGTST